MRPVLAAFLALIAGTAQASPRIEGDARAIGIYRTGISATVANMRAIAAGAKGKVLSGPEKARAHGTWSSFLDYQLALDSIGAYHVFRRASLRRC